MTDEIIRKDSVRLFKFLRELSILRSDTIRTLDKYESVVWFSDVPDKPGCESVFMVQNEERSEVWLEVEQPRIPSPPEVPMDVHQWLDQETLNDFSLEFPRLMETIAVQRVIAEPSAELSETAEETGESLQQLTLGASNDAESSSASNFEATKTAKRGRPARKQQYTTEYLKLSDFPEVSRQWEAYVTEHWQNWALEAKPHLPVRIIYEKLFAIQHMIQKLAEHFELLLGFGCLSWNTPGNQRVFRHVLTIRASLHFDAARGMITIGASSEGAELQLEQDMLDLNERPQGAQRKSIDSLRADLAEDIWNEVKLTELLETYARAISPRGKYSDSLEPVREISADPIICLAPAIIFRKRTDRHFAKLFEEIVAQLEDGQDIPIGVQRLVSIVDDENTEEGNSFDGEKDEEIYFPLPANPDQREIAQRLMTRQGILVQGPPGTGKSHTITNLVCHLLAQGKRILVTSHTPRALSVLREKFPDELKALCVSVVGDDTSESRAALEDSVAGITAKNNSWNAQENTKLIENLRKRVSDLREEEQWILNSLRTIKEKDTYVHAYKFSRYSGTAQAIARQLQGENSDFGWIPESPSADVDIPLSNQELQDLLGLLRRFDSKVESETRLKSLDEKTLLPPKKFTELVSRHKDASTKLSGLDSIRKHESYVASTKLNSTCRLDLTKKLDELIGLYQSIAKRPESFAKEAAQEITADHDRKWRELLLVTKQQLEKIGTDYREVAQLTVTGLANRDLRMVKSHAEALQSHLQNGGKLGFGPFRSKPVKNAIYLVSETRVDGVLCDSTNALSKLTSWINLEVAVDLLKRNWEGICDKFPGSTLTAIAAFEDFCEPLEASMLLHDRMLALREMLDNLPSLVAPNWDDLESVRQFRNVIDSGAVEEDLNKMIVDLKSHETNIRACATDPNAHQCVVNMLEAFISLNDDAYHEAFDDNLKLQRAQADLARRDNFMRALRAKAPKVAKQLAVDFQNPEWSTRGRYFEEAWYWAQASCWIEELNEASTYQKMTADLENVQSNIRDTLGSLASAKSWEHAFNRLNEDQRQHLISWSMAVKRIGKGKGKYAGKHRRDARQHMEKCRTAIPAWIMPIHKVVESIKPGRDAFDVVIVDEASQSGPEALFLLYLGKQLVVVGDDKQISPDFVGLDRSSVDALREEYLKGIPHSDAIGVDHSLFDQAKIRYRGKIRLKEHFRCMPEIIQFSNNLCYASDPLIPLRQYGGGRLSPVVKTVYLPGGYHAEESRKAVNKPEGDAILNEIKRICSDPAYEGKTIGVISLLNTSGQTDYIETGIKAGGFISETEIQARKIRVGDPYVFQGDERDIVLLSMVSAPPKDGRKVHAMSAEKDERRFNVAASRARDQLILFHSVTLNELNPKCVRHKLLSYCEQPHVESAGVDGFDLLQLSEALHKGYNNLVSLPAPFDSWFELDVFLRIAKRGFRVVPQVLMNGYKIDLIVEGLKGRLAVECDGDKWHGPDQFDADMARQRDLERCGMQFWRVRGSAYYHKPEESLDELWATLARLQIHPTVTDMPTEFERLKSVEHIYSFSGDRKRRVAESPEQ